MYIYIPSAVEVPLELLKGDEYTPRLEEGIEEIND
jgi:hypothetical protein